MFTSIVIALKVSGQRADPRAPARRFHSARLGGLPVELVGGSRRACHPAATFPSSSGEPPPTASSSASASCSTTTSRQQRSSIASELAARCAARHGYEGEGSARRKLRQRERNHPRLHRPPGAGGRPRASTGTGLRPTLIACAESDDLDAAAPVIASWVRTFDGGPPRSPTCRRRRRSEPTMTPRRERWSACDSFRSDSGSWASSTGRRKWFTAPTWRRRWRRSPTASTTRSSWP